MSFKRILAEPKPYYMTAMGMQGARFLEGNNGEPAGTPPAAPVEPAKPAAPATPPAPAAGDEQLGEGGKKALDSERNRAKQLEKDLAAANKKIQDAEDAKLSALDLANKKAADAEARATALESKNRRYEALAGKDIPQKFHVLVQGNTAEELEASAVLVAELYGGKPNVDANGKPIKPSIQPIPGSGTGDQNSDSNSVAAGRALYQQRHGKK